MKISIYTVTMGRELYLKRLVSSVVKNLRKEHEVIHHIAFNGYERSNEIHEWLLEQLSSTLTFLGEKNYNIILQTWPNRCAAGEANNNLISKFDLNTELCIKADDDCVWVSDNFLDHVIEVYRLLGPASFSPFPVGLINNLAGPPGKNRYVLYGENTDTYYTFREVDHIGGFGRITPYDILKEYKWDNKSNGEDVDFSRFCQKQNIPMFYLENALIIEHSESTIGQFERYGGEYFGRK